MTADQQSDINNLFSRYGSPSKEAEFRIAGYYTRADCIDELDWIKSSDERVQRDIEELQVKIRQLSAYRISLAERYNFLATAPTVPIVRLIRHRESYSGKVLYRLLTFSRNLADGHEIQTGCTIYPGTERHKAIDAYKEYIKTHPGIESEMQIEKSRWER